MRQVIHAIFEGINVSSYTFYNYMSNLTAIISLKSDKVLDEPVWIIGAK